MISHKKLILDQIRSIVPDIAREMNDQPVPNSCAKAYAELIELLDDNSLRTEYVGSDN